MALPPSPWRLARCFDGLAAMADADAEYVINHPVPSCAATRRQILERCQPRRRDHVDDIDLMTSMQLVWAMLRENYTSFFAQPVSSPAPAQ